MSVKKPQPLIRRRTHERCPVCGEISYSLGGVHPQCAVQQADAKRVERIKREKKAKKAASASDGVKPWQKVCPKCKAVQHVRKQVCPCGHTFSAQVRHSVREGDPS